jgi:hypothetical protein
MEYHSGNYAIHGLLPNKAQLGVPFMMGNPEMFLEHIETGC